jgi:hypothetical protein
VTVWPTSLQKNEKKNLVGFQYKTISQVLCFQLNETKFQEQIKLKVRCDIVKCTDCNSVTFLIFIMVKKLDFISKVKSEITSLVVLIDSTFCLSCFCFTASI